MTAIPTLILIFVRKYFSAYAVILLCFLFALNGYAQSSPDPPVTDDDDSSAQKYRLLQSNEFFVDTAFLQDKGELQHTFSFTRTNRRGWSMTFTEELPLGSEKHQLSVSVPVQLSGTGADRNKGFGDVELEYNYALIGGSFSRVAVSPGFSITLPTGSAEKELGAGGPGLSFNVPVGIMLGKRFASNTAFEVTYTRAAKNDEREKANTVDYEVGQSFVWFAKPKLNFLIEAVWDHSQEVIGQGLKRYENEFLSSPGVRWAYVFKNGLVVSPGVALPVGVGPSRGEKGIFFYLSFEHLIGKEH